MNFKNLLNNVVDPGYCVGCGTCVSMCNFETISMKFNDIGQYEPFYVDESTCTSCGLCLNVCPFENKNDNEDVIGARKFKDLQNILHQKETGYYLDSFVGYADEKTRLQGASGGSVSQVLKWLLLNDKIDKIITVESTNNSDMLFQYTIVETIEDIDRCAKSVYYPTEVSKVLEIARKSKDTRYAIVGLPCTLKAVENAKNKSKSLRKNIKYTLGLVCGQVKSKRYTEYIIDSLNVEKNKVIEVNHRKKIVGNSANNYGFHITTIDNHTVCKTWDEGIDTVWVNDLFKQKSCYFCDDIFAEYSDMVFMDAWLPEYAQDYKGTSLIVSRNELLSEVVLSMNYEHISIDKVIDSQKGVIVNKHSNIDVLNKLALETESIVPIKRKYSSSNSINNPIVKKYNWAMKTRNIAFKDVKNILNEITKSIPIKTRLKSKVYKILKKLGVVGGK